MKVILEPKRADTGNQENLQGSGSVISRGGKVDPPGRIVANMRQTSVQRSSGIFVLVRDRGESILSIATRVPQSRTAYFHNYSASVGYTERRIVFNDVGTSLRVSVVTVTDGQVRLRLMPRISVSPQNGPALSFARKAAAFCFRPKVRIANGSMSIMKRC